MNLSHRRRSAVVSTFLGMAALAACGGSSPGDVSAGSSDTVVDTTDAAADTTEAARAGGVDTVAASTVQIVAQGTFVDPEFGAYEGAGSGTGFVIDPSGIAVTNNHVVGGAGLLKVYVPGEDKPRNAKVLGVSECSDLAVIDIDGDDLPALSWYEGDVEPGLEIYAAGYPLGDPEYTLTRGIVAKAEANGETQWASVDHVLEHDASIQPGNSGGPLVADDGSVVGINYAGQSSTNTEQFLAIAAADARPIVEQLQEGNSDSLGVNGQVVQSDDGSLSGLWVSGVASGSAADLAGVVPGDIITELEGVSVGTDGTMADYCDVVRTHNAGDAMSMQVVRYSTEEVLTGQFNGTPLAAVASFADETTDTVPASSTSYDYVTVQDDSGQISVSMPAAWSDISGEAVDFGGVASPAIKASTDLAAFGEGWTVPGAEVFASTSFSGYDADGMLDAVARTDCTSQGRQDYTDGVLTGKYEIYSDCGGSAQLLSVALFPADNAYGVYVEVVILTDADFDAADALVQSLTINA